MAPRAFGQTDGLALDLAGARVITPEVARAILAKNAAFGTDADSTAPGHLAGSNALDPVGHAAVRSAAQLKYRLPSQDAVDGNTVDMDVERSNFATNAIHYEANLTQLTGRIKDLISAMQSG